jgi:hypothetical protein
MSVPTHERADASTVSVVRQSDERSANRHQDAKGDQRQRTILGGQRDTEHREQASGDRDDDDRGNLETHELARSQRRHFEDNLLRRARQARGGAPITGTGRSAIRVRRGENA